MVKQTCIKLEFEKVKDVIVIKRTDKDIYDSYVAR